MLGRENQQVNESQGTGYSVPLHDAFAVPIHYRLDATCS